MLLLTVPALVLLNGLFVAVEFALVSVRKRGLEERRPTGLSGARRVRPAMDNRAPSTAATQRGIPRPPLGRGFAGEPARPRLIEPLFPGLGKSVSWLTSHGVAVF